MSQQVNLSAIKKAIDEALEGVDAYLDGEKTPSPKKADRAYAKKLKGSLEKMRSTVEEDCDDYPEGDPGFLPNLEDDPSSA